MAHDTIAFTHSHIGSVPPSLPTCIRCRHWGPSVLSILAFHDPFSACRLCVLVMFVYLRKYNGFANSDL